MSNLQFLRWRFGDRFPSTREFSECARGMVSVDPLVDPDQAVVEWVRLEESLFREFERDEFKQWMAKTSPDDVDAYLGKMVSLNNRRKSRAGHGLENHVQYLLERFSLPFSRSKITENKRTPDFTLPSIEAYRDPSYPKDKLVVVGVKHSVKDRWRQIVVEADRAAVKYLFTVDVEMSASKVDEMINDRLLPVVPLPLQSCYPESMREKFLTVRGLIDIICSRCLDFGTVDTVFDGL